MTYKNVMKRRLYMREYMRKYRLKNKNEPAIPGKENVQAKNHTPVKAGDSNGI